MSLLADWVDVEGWGCAGKMLHDTQYFQSLEGMVVETFSVHGLVVAAVERISAEESGFGLKCNNITCRGER